MKRITYITTIIALSSFFLHVSTSVADAKKEFTYKTYKAKSGRELNNFSVEIKKLRGGKKEFVRKFDGDSHIVDEQFVLDKNYETQSFMASHPDEGTDYAGERSGNELIITGKLKGEEIEKTIAFDNRPFYYTPKFNLTGFILSDKENIEFWMLRKDKLSKYLMKAKKVGEETIEVNGKEIDVVKIYYSATGAGEKFYKRYYYYRKRDGLFIKKESPNGKASVAELIREG